MPTLVPTAVRQDDGRYEIAAHPVGGVLDEPLLATPDGISGSSPIAFLEQFYRVPHEKAVKALAACLEPSRPSDPPPNGEPGAVESDEVRQLAGDEDALNARALANLDAWLPKLCPDAVRQDDGSYLIAADREGGVLSEPIIATAQGISGSSPIALHEQWLGMPREKAACWLANSLLIATALGDEDEVSPREAKSRERQKHKKDLNDLYKESAKGRTTIRYHPYAFTSAAKQTEREMMKWGAQVYVRGAKLVRPVVVAAEGANGKPTKVAQLAKIKVPYMRQLMDRAAIYEFPDESKWTPDLPSQGHRRADPRPRRRLALPAGHRRHHVADAAA